MQMTTVVDLAGSSLEEALEFAKKAQEGAKKQSLIATWSTFEFGT
jgi:hypothetical protein